MKRKSRAIRSRTKIARQEKPRLVVFKSNKFIYAQVVGPDGRVRGGVKDTDPEKAGKEIAKLAKEAKLDDKIVFDRSGYKYHGQIRKLAEAARAEGLKF